MTVQNRLKYALVFGLFFFSLGGGMLHYYIHPSSKNSYAFVPMIAAIISVGLVPWLFLSKRTLHLGYLLNGFMVIVGSVTMGHYAVVARPIWPDIFILWAKFLMGYALFHLESFPVTADIKPGLKTIRYPHFGFWVVHLLAISTIYTLGATLWR